MTQNMGHARRGKTQNRRKGMERSSGQIALLLKNISPYQVRSEGSKWHVNNYRLYNNGGVREGTKESGLLEVCQRININ